MSAEDQNQSADGAGGPRDGGAGVREQAREKAEFILSRAYGLIRDPKAEWEQIRAEETNAASLMLGYVAPLAAIPPVAGLIGQLAFGRGVSTPAQILVGAVASFIVFVGVVYFLGLLINVIAESFDGDRNELAALKVAAYSPTPAFLLGVASIWPDAWWVGLIGIGLSAYLLHRGLPPLMKCPADRALSFSAAIVVAGLVALAVLGALTGGLAGQESVNT
jgi:hypothetical protein